VKNADDLLGRSALLGIEYQRAGLSPLLSSTLRLNAPRHRTVRGAGVDG
jgi:hypothetical protein